MRIAIVQFPGSNAERETRLAVKRAGMEPVDFLWNAPRQQLAEMDGFVLVGGFSYEDRSRAGIIAALDPVMDEIKAQSALGKPILGICNGAQILVESGLVPGLESNKIGLALTQNKRIVRGKVLTGFYNAWASMRPSKEYQRNAFTRRLDVNDVLTLPIAHAEGRFMVPPALLQEIEAQGLDVFHYCPLNQEEAADFQGPNGSVHHIAAIANKAGNVLAMMPHPERSSQGDAIFLSMRDYLEEGHYKKRTKTMPLYYWPRPSPRTVYRAGPQSRQLIIELNMTDNHAATVQQALHRLGLPVSVRRWAHWEIDCETDSAYQQTKSCGVLFNGSKEKEVAPGQVVGPFSSVWLVRAKEDLVGIQKRQALQDCFGVSGIRALYQGTLWSFHLENGNIGHLIDAILSAHIIYNPYAHECFQYVR